MNPILLGLLESIQAYASDEKYGWPKSSQKNLTDIFAKLEEINQLLPTGNDQ